MKKKPKSTDEAKDIFNLCVMMIAFKNENYLGSAVHEVCGEGLFERTAVYLPFSGGITLVACYTPAFEAYRNCVDFRIKFEGSDCLFSIYDIFNHFNINDFELYSYCDCADEKRMEEVVNRIFDVFTKNSESLHYIADNKDELAKLENQHKKDFAAAWGGAQIGFSEIQRNSNQLFFKRPTAFDYSAKGLKKFMKSKSFGASVTLYEKRLLTYVQSGGIPNDSLCREHFHITGRARLGAVAILFVISVLISAVAYGIMLAAIFTDAYMPGLNAAEIFSNTAALTAFVCPPILLIFGTALSKAISKKDPKSKNPLITRKSSDKELAVCLIIGLVILPWCIGPACFVPSAAGFYDEGFVKFIPDNAFAIRTASYNELNIYRAEGCGSEDDYTAYDEPHYIIEDDGHYYEFNEGKQGGRVEKKIFEIAEKYEKEIVTIKSADELDFEEDYGLDDDFGIEAPKKGAEIELLRLFPF